MPDLTSKEILQQIRQTQKENAEAFFKYAQNMSNFMNKQEGINAKFSQYLESNSATNQEGAIEKLDRVEKHLFKLEHKIEKKIAFFTGAGIAIWTIGKWAIAKLFT